VKFRESSEKLDKWLASKGVKHQLIPNDELAPLRNNHAFTPGGTADVDSRRQAIAWVKEHLAPVPK
jgi:hypothetical protein